MSAGGLQLQMGFRRRGSLVSFQTVLLAEYGSTATGTNDPKPMLERNREGNSRSSLSQSPRYHTIECPHAAHSCSSFDRWRRASPVKGCRTGSPQLLWRALTIPHPNPSRAPQAGAVRSNRTSLRQGTSKPHSGNSVGALWCPANTTLWPS